LAIPGACPICARSPCPRRRRREREGVERRGGRAALPPQAEEAADAIDQVGLDVGAAGGGALAAGRLEGLAARGEDLGDLIGDLGARGDERLEDVLVDAVALEVGDRRRRWPSARRRS
jgi:hypothetical protein